VHASPDTTWIYQLLPSIVAILISATSPLFGSRLIDKLNSDYPCKSTEEQEYAEDIALDWSARTGFQSALLSTLVSAIVAATGSGSVLVIVLVGVASLVVMSLTRRGLLGEPLGDFRQGRFSPALTLNLLLVICNLVIIILIALGSPDRRAQVTQLLSWLLT
jgi:hypothetical protein